MQSWRRTAARPGDVTSRRDSADPGLLATRAWQPVTGCDPDGEKAIEVTGSRALHVTGAVVLDVSGRRCVHLLYGSVRSQWAG